MSFSPLHFKKWMMVLPLAAILLFAAGCSSTKESNSSDTSSRDASTVNREVSDNSSKIDKARGTTYTLSNARATAKYFDADIEFEVKNVTLDFYPKGLTLGDPKDEGEQFVRVEMAVKNIGSEPFDVNSTTFMLNNSKEQKTTYTILVNDGNASDFLVDKTLQTGESSSGALYFEAPATDTLENLSMSFEGWENLEEKLVTIPFKQ